MVRTFLDPSGMFFPQTVFSCRGSGGFGRGPWYRPGCRAAECLAKFIVKINTKSSKCQKLNVFKYFFMKMLIIAERHTTFWSLRHLRPPWGHLGSPGLPDASQMPPRCLPDASRCLQMPPDASRCLPDASQMPPDASRCLLHDAISMYP